jgi:hypothetical protein
MSAPCPPDISKTYFDCFDSKQIITDDAIVYGYDSAKALLDAVALTTTRHGCPKKHLRWETAPPEPIPHPDHIEIDINTGEVIVSVLFTARRKETLGWTGKSVDRRGVAA